MSKYWRGAHLIRDAVYYGCLNMKVIQVAYIEVGPSYVSARLAHNWTADRSCCNLILLFAFPSVAWLTVWLNVSVIHLSYIYPGCLIAR